jgi:hypothetical protein
MKNTYGDEKVRWLTLSASASSLYKGCGCVFPLLFLILFTASCTQVRGGQPIIPHSHKKAETNRSKKACALKIISKGTELKELKYPRIYFRYIQYSVDGKLLGAHKVKDDYEYIITLSEGKHKLHVERATRGMLSARAFILDEGDCYIFTLSGGQTAIFEGKAFPDDVWEKIGFSGVESWEKVDSLENCYE